MATFFYNDVGFSLYVFIRWIQCVYAIARSGYTWFIVLHIFFWNLDHFCSKSWWHGSTDRTVRFFLILDVSLGIIEKNFSSKLEFKLFFLELGLSNKMRSFFTIFCEFGLILALPSWQLCDCFAVLHFWVIYSYFFDFFILTIFFIFGDFCFGSFNCSSSNFCSCSLQKLISYNFIFSVNFCLFFSKFFTFQH